MADISMLAAVTKVTRGIGDIATRISTAESELEDSQVDFQRLFDFLRPLVADQSTLITISTPPRDTVLSHRDSCRTLDQHIVNCRERVRAAEREHDRHYKAYKRLAHDDEAVAPDDLAQARKHRDTGWSLIRRHFVDGEPVTEIEFTAFGSPENKLADAYEGAVRSADDLSDLRFDKAESAARLAVTSRQLAEQEELLHSLRKEAFELEAQYTTLDAEWCEMWSEAPFEPLKPDEMLEWLTTRDAALSAIDRRATTERRLAVLHRQEAQARKSVLDELDELGTNTDKLAHQPLAVVLETAAEIIHEHERAVEVLRQLEEAHRQSAVDTERKNKALKYAEESWSEWQSQWSRAIDVLGFDLDANPEVVARQVNSIDEMRTIVVRVNELRHERIGKIDRDATAFSKDVARLVGTVALDLAEVEPEEAVIQLEQRLSQAKRLQEQIKDKEEVIKNLERMKEEYESKRREAGDVISGLQETAGVTDVDMLKVAIDKSDRLRVLHVEQAQILEALLKEGDGLSVADLEEECNKRRSRSGVSS